MAAKKARIHEVDFCAQVASTARMLVSQNPEAFRPLHDARVEGFGSGQRRKDLRFFNRDGKLELCGEVKLPGTREGRSPYDAKLCADAEAKASDAGVRYFFTWNVNVFVLWDRSLWERPLLDRRVWERRLSRTLATAEEVANEDNLEFVKTQFLPDLLRDLADIISGRRRDWSMPPDDIFIRSLESHLDWPVQLLSSYLLRESEKAKAFDLRVQKWMADQDWTFLRAPHEEWAKALVNMAKTLAYVWANRFMFYKALRARFPDLRRLELRPSLKKPTEALASLNRLFEEAVVRSGDYESLLMPNASDWATEIVFRPEGALDAWRGLLRGIESIDFREVPSDVVGRIFQKLIGPEERHRYGQHFTGDDVVDLINTFCIHGASDTVLDPACGSGSFLVRAYYRKRQLEPGRGHVALIDELFGCDIAVYPAHLATLNLAAREINAEANYPRITRRNFFDISRSEPFCQIPDINGEPRGVLLPELDAVVGNPPYVSQLNFDAADKARFAAIAEEAWPDLHIAGRSDLHCYFWPAAARFLKRDGYFGFLTSSSWLDAEYGFALQRWLLGHFRILAIMESAAEPWFDDARVKTCVTIVQRCDDNAARMTNRVRFVRFARKLVDIIGIPSGQDELARTGAFESLRKLILGGDVDAEGRDLRIIVKSQHQLWDDGVRAGVVLPNSIEAELAGVSDDQGGAGTVATVANVQNGLFAETAQYRAGKWGRYLRAPDWYFEVMGRFGARFVPLGEIAEIRRGITSGCDAFFMPNDISDELLAFHAGDREFRRHAGGAPRADVQAGKLKIVKAGDGSIHPIEAKYLAPELHSLMKVDRPVVCAGELDRVVLLVDKPLEKLKEKSPWVWRYLRYGATATFASSRSSGVPVPKRSTCAARDRWYDLTGLAKPGFAFWAKSQQYRHIVPGNPENVIGNCNLYDMASAALREQERFALVAVLNSTLIALFKNFFGRFAGTEGNLKTEIVDVNLLEVPDPRGAPAALLCRLIGALERMQRRKVGRLVEEQLIDCHSPERARRLADGPLVRANELREADRYDLDDAVFELLGVTDSGERAQLIGQLYDATASYFRSIRVVEIEKMQQRAQSRNNRFTTHDLAADIWDAAELADATPIAEWINSQSDSIALVSIPEDRPVFLSTDVMFSPNTVYFGRARKTHVDCASRGQAELVARLAELSVVGDVTMPAELAPCFKLLSRLNDRLEKAIAHLKALAESRTSDERVRSQLLDVLLGWFVLGRELLGRNNAERMGFESSNADDDPTS